LKLRESFEGDPDVTQGGHRFVQLTVGETSVADGIKPLMLNRVVDNIPPLGIEYPILILLSLLNMVWAVEVGCHCLYLH
jgi:hypothetical protein